MSKPASRTDFKDYCLRKLGSPVINIEVDDTQVEDRIDDALDYFWEWSFEGSEKVYYSHQVTQTDIDNRYITLPDNILGAVRLFDPSTYGSIANMFDIRYQIALNDLYTLTSQSLVPYYMTMQHLSLMEDILVGHKQIRYNRWNNICHIDMDWNIMAVGNFLLVEAFQIVDPDVYSKVWGDRWLLRYATALIQIQWASNLSKFQMITLPGGYQMNGQQILAQGMQEKAECEQFIQNNNVPTPFIIG
jgi:hypothetical protein